jgi:hypothetical protein
MPCRARRRVRPRTRRATRSVHATDAVRRTGVRRRPSSRFGPGSASQGASPLRGTRRSWGTAHLARVGRTTQAPSAATVPLPAARHLFSTARPPCHRVQWSGGRAAATTSRATSVAAMRLGACVYERWAFPSSLTAPTSGPPPGRARCRDSAGAGRAGVGEGVGGRPGPVAVAAPPWAGRPPRRHRQGVVRPRHARAVACGRPSPVVKVQYVAQQHLCRRARVQTTSRVTAERAPRAGPADAGRARPPGAQPSCGPRPDAVRERPCEP